MKCGSLKKHYRTWTWTLLIVTSRLNCVRPGVKPMAAGGRGYHGWLVQMHLLRGHHPTVSYSSPPILRCNAHSILCLVSHRCYLIGWHGRQEGGVIKGDKGTNATSQRSGGDPPLLSADAFLALHTVSCLLTFHIQVSSHSLGWQSENNSRYFVFKDLHKCNFGFPIKNLHKCNS